MPPRKRSKKERKEENAFILLRSQYRFDFPVGPVAFEQEKKLGWTISCETRSTTSTLPLTLEILNSFKHLGIENIKDQPIFMTLCPYRLVFYPGLVPAMDVIRYYQGHVLTLEPVLVGEEKRIKWKGMLYSNFAEIVGETPEPVIGFGDVLRCLSLTCRKLSYTFPVIVEENKIGMFIELMCHPAALSFYNAQKVLIEGAVVIPKENGSEPSRKVDMDPLDPPV
jgi:hypothetical protein